MKKCFFTLLAFIALIAGLSSCGTDNEATTGSVSFTIDGASLLQKARSARTENLLKESVPDMVSREEDPATMEQFSNVLTIALRGDYSATQTVTLPEFTDDQPQTQQTISFEQIPLGNSVYAVATLTENSTIDGRTHEYLAWFGTSDRTVITEGSNTLNLTLFSPNESSEQLDMRIDGKNAKDPDEYYTFEAYHTSSDRNSGFWLITKNYRLSSIGTYTILSRNAKKNPTSVSATEYAFLKDDSYQIVSNPVTQTLPVLGNSFAFTTADGTTINFGESVTVSFWFNDGDDKYAERQEYPSISSEDSNFDTAYSQTVMAILNGGYIFNESKSDAEPVKVDGKYVLRLYFDKQATGIPSVTITFWFNDGDGKYVQKDEYPTVTTTMVEFETVYASLVYKIGASGYVFNENKQTYNYNQKTNTYEYGFYFDKQSSVIPSVAISFWFNDGDGKYVQKTEYPTVTTTMVEFEKVYASLVYKIGASGYVFNESKQTYNYNQKTNTYEYGFYFDKQALIIPSVVISFWFNDGDGKYVQKDEFPTITTEMTEFEKVYQGKMFEIVGKGYVFNENKQTYNYNQKTNTYEYGFYFDKNTPSVSLTITYLFNEGDGNYVQKDEYPNKTVTVTEINDETYSKAMQEYVATKTTLGLKGYYFNETKSDALPELVGGTYILKGYFDKNTGNPTPFVISFWFNDGDGVYYQKTDKYPDITATITGTSDEAYSTAMTQAQTPYMQIPMLEGYNANPLIQDNTIVVRDGKYTRRYYFDKVGSVTYPLTIQFWFDDGDGTNVQKDEYPDRHATIKSIADNEYITSLTDVFGAVSNAGYVTKSGSGQILIINGEYIVKYYFKKDASSSYSFTISYLFNEGDGNYVQKDNHPDKTVTISSLNDEKYRTAVTAAYQDIADLKAIGYLKNDTKTKTDPVLENGKYVWNVYFDRATTVTFDLKDVDYNDGGENFTLTTTSSSNGTLTCVVIPQGTVDGDYEWTLDGTSLEETGATLVLSVHGETENDRHYISVTFKRNGKDCAAYQYFKVTYSN